MKVDELVEGLPSIERGGAVDIDGFFVMCRGVGYFVSSREGKDDTQSAVLIRHENLEKCLLSSVPALGGSRYSYVDQAKVSGTLSGENVDGFACVVDNIRDFVIYKYGEAMRVNL
ncbi:hypothetical protein [Burkholderia sp. BE17]|uniref:hypothetical protein n=1 Tax=Burkholderia sp. BE17 TaxID=2656644 RepID=UPI00128BF0E9|nr:hypothetical protein [Burkholderia sp. BE17]MPV68629.1 hypothetical protein [Burkholderia sp. BE17]